MTGGKLGVPQHSELVPCGIQVLVFQIYRNRAVQNSHRIRGAVLKEGQVSQAVSSRRSAPRINPLQFFVCLFRVLHLSFSQLGHSQPYIREHEGRIHLEYGLLFTDP